MIWSQPRTFDLVSECYLKVLEREHLERFRYEGPKSFGRFLRTVLDGVIVETGTARGKIVVEGF